jgi:hypothetical protein
MRRLRDVIIFIVLFTKSSFAFVIDPFPKNAPLLEIFSTNCLQMTQSQQMLKAYVMVGLNSTFQSPKERLAEAIPVYDSRMHQVKAYFHNKLGSDIAAKKAFDDAMGLWKESKKMLLLPPTQVNALKIKNNFLIMIDKLLQGTKPLATPDLELISLTGKLCRKPLEITIDYLMRIWGINIENYESKTKKTIERYHENLKTLSENRLNNEQSRKLLKKAKREFRYLEVMYKSKRIFIPSLLSRKADTNFKIIRDIKKIYKGNSL